MSKQRLVVITGTSCVGKSTLAGRINSEMSFDKMTSTDTVREDITRSVKIKVAKMPPIGASSDKDE